MKKEISVCSLERKKAEKKSICCLLLPKTGNLVRKVRCVSSAHSKESCKKTNSDWVQVKKKIHRRVVKKHSRSPKANCAICDLGDFSKLSWARPLYSALVKPPSVQFWAPFSGKTLMQGHQHDVETGEPLLSEAERLFSLERRLRRLHLKYTNN